MPAEAAYYNVKSVLGCFLTADRKCIFAEKASSLDSGVGQAVLSQDRHTDLNANLTLDLGWPCMFHLWLKNDK